MQSTEYGFALLALAILHVFAHGLRGADMASRDPPQDTLLFFVTCLWAVSTVVMVVCALRLMGIYVL